MKYPEKWTDLVAAAKQSVTRALWLLYVALCEANEIPPTETRASKSLRGEMIDAVAEAMNVSGESVRTALKNARADKLPASGKSGGGNGSRRSVEEIVAEWSKAKCEKYHAALTKRLK